jgi:hypothetical protein
MEPRKTRITRNERVFVFGEGEVPSEPQHFCVWDSRFSTTDKHRWARIIGDLLAVVDGTTKDTEDTEGERVLFGGAKFHVSRRIPVFRDSRFFNHG